VDYPEGFIKAYGTDMFAVKATAEYHGSAEFDDVLDIHGRTARLGRTSMQFLLEIWRGATHLVSGELIYVNADPATKKSAPLPAAFRQKILGYERVRPDEAQAAS